MEVPEWDVNTPNIKGDMNICYDSIENAVFVLNPQKIKLKPPPLSHKTLEGKVGMRVITLS